jgi:hypothetical protein
MGWLMTVSEKRLLSHQNPSGCNSGPGMNKYGTRSGISPLGVFCLFERIGDRFELQLILVVEITNLRREF